MMSLNCPTSSPYVASCSSEIHPMERTSSGRGREETTRLTSNAFCIAPGPNQPKSPPFRADEQSLSVLAISANALGTSFGGRDLSLAMCPAMMLRASGRVVVTVSCCQLCSVTAPPESA